MRILLAVEGDGWYKSHLKCYLLNLDALELVHCRNGKQTINILQIKLQDFVFLSGRREKLLDKQEQFNK